MQSYPFRVLLILSQLKKGGKGPRESLAGGSSFSSVEGKTFKLSSVHIVRTTIRTVSRFTVYIAPSHCEISATHFFCEVSDSHYLLSAL